MIFVCVAMFFIGTVSAAGDWAYTGDHDPSHWKEDCQKKHQSPINFVTDKLEFNPGLLKPRLNGYGSNMGVVKMTNNGHSVAIAFPERLPNNQTVTMTLPTLTGTYRAHSLHFHWGTVTTKGSEHTVDSKSYPMEMHIVHYNAKYSSLGESLSHGDGLAVLGFFFEESSLNNDKLNPITDALVNVQEKDDYHVIGKLSLSDLMLSDEDMSSYYRYNGSLTTPPCSEVIAWTVFTKPVKIGSKQMSLFRKNIHLSAHMDNNFRPVQPLNGRIVFTGDSSLVGASSVVTSSILLLIACLFVSRQL